MKEFIDSNFWGWESPTFVYPRYEIVPEDGKKTIKMYLPGKKKEEIKIKVEGVSYLLVEHGKETNKFYLDEDTDVEKITAKLEDGILSIVLPEKESYTKIIQIG